VVEIKHEIIDVTAISVLFQSEVEVLIMMIRRTDGRRAWCQKRATKR